MHNKPAFMKPRRLWGKKTVSSGALREELQRQADTGWEVFTVLPADPDYQNYIIVLYRDVRGNMGEADVPEEKPKKRNNRKSPKSKSAN